MKRKNPLSSAAVQRDRMHLHRDSEVSVLMISLNYPRPSNPSFGAWFQNQIGAYTAYSNIFLLVPVHVTPSISIMMQSPGLSSKIKSLKNQLMNSFQPFPSFWTPVAGKYVRFASIPPKQLFPYSGGMVLACRLFFFMAMNNRFDVIHGQSIFPEGLSAVLLGKLFDKPSVVTSIGSDIHGIEKGSITYQSTLFVLNNATLITTVSKDLKHRIMAMGIADSKIVVVPNGIDPDFQKKGNAMDIRQRMNIPVQAKVFGFVGRLIPVKDPLSLMAAFGRLMKAAGNVYLVFVGDGELKGKLVQEAKRQGISSHVRFSEGMVAPQEIPSYMQSFDYLCVSSTGEGWPNVIFEAMVCGKPVIGTRVGGIPEAIIGNDYGLLVPPQDPDAMMGAMQQALNTHWNRNKIASYAKQNSWNKVGEKYHKIYSQLCSERNRKCSIGKID